MAQICWRCSKKSGFWGGYDRKWECCGECFKDIRNEFRALRTHYDVPQLRMDARRDAADYIAYYVGRTEETKKFIPQESALIRGLALVFGLETLVHPSLTEIEKGSIQGDELPIITPDISLVQDETCYLEVPALHELAKR